MMARTAFAALALSALASIGLAETEAIYAGQQNREVKSLSPDYIEGLSAGAGLGFGKPAELNGWPGPLHVLEIADLLGLSDEQIAVVKAIREEMLSKAVPLGEALIAAERDLEKLFLAKPDRSVILEAASRAGAIKAKLRTVHLVAHLRTAPVLSRHQRMMYNRVRGYAGGAGEYTHGGHQ